MRASNVPRRALMVLLLLASLISPALCRDDVGKWRGLLYDDDPEMRSMAALSLLDAEGADALDALRDALQDATHQPTRLTILKAIVLKGDDRLLGEMIALLGEQDAKAAEAAAAALSSRRSVVAVETMVGELAETRFSAVIRCKLARTLAEMRELRAVPTLIELLNAPEDPLRTAALESLEKITMRSYGYDQQGWRAWWEPAKERPREALLEEVIQLQAQKMRQLSDQVSELWIRVLSLCDLTKDPRLLRDALESEFPSVKVFAARKVAEVKPEGGVEMLLPHASSPDVQVRQAAVAALGELGDKAAVAPLIAALSDAEARVAGQAAAALGRIRSAEAVPALLGLVGAGAAESAAVAARSLGDIGDQRAVEPLSAVLLNPKLERGVREEAAGALGKMPDPTGVRALTRALEDADERIRWAAADSLGRPELAEAIAPLGRILCGDKDPRVREVAALSLGRTKQKEAVAFLAAGLDDGEARVAEQSLAAITGILGASVEDYAAVARDMVGRNESGRAVRLCRAALERIARAEPTKDVSPLNRLLGLSLANEGKWSEARRLLEGSLEAYPDDKLLCERMVRCYSELGEHDAAIDRAAKAMKRLPAEAVALVEAALPSLEALVQSGRTEPALKFIESVSPEALQALPEARRRQLDALRERCSKGAGGTPSGTRLSTLLGVNVALGSDDAEGRRRAAAQLAQLGDKAVPELIGQGLGSKERQVVEVTIEALEQITGHPFGLGPGATPEQHAAAVKAWIEWWHRNSADRPGVAPL